MIVVVVIKLNLGHAISRLEEPHDPGAIPAITFAAIVSQFPLLGRGTTTTVDA
jgi:hypothetical protein